MGARGARALTAIASASPRRPSLAQAEHEWSRSLAETKAAHEAVLGDLLTLETQLGVRLLRLASAYTPSGR